MFNNGFIDIKLSNINIQLGNVKHNANEVLKVLNKTKLEEASIICFPELVLTGKSLNDLLYHDELYFDCLDGLCYVLENNNYEGIAIIGGILKYDEFLFNVSYVVKKDEILGVVPRFNYSIDELVNFASFNDLNIDGAIELEILGFVVPFGKMIFSNGDDLKFAVCVGELDEVSEYYINGATVVFNPCAIQDYKDNVNKILDYKKACSAKYNGACLIASIGASDSSSEVMYSNLLATSIEGKIINKFDGISFEENEIISRIDLGRINYLQNKNNDCLFNVSNNDIDYVDIVFDEVDYDGIYNVNKYPFIYHDDKEYQRIIDLQAASMYKRLKYIGIQKVILGVSGGLDSTLALLSLAHMCDMFNLNRKNIIGVRLPSSNNSSKTYNNSKKIMEYLGIDDREINISEGVKADLLAIGHDTITKDVTYENAQARYRTLTLMNLANKEGGLVCGTGDMSEIALGWCTFNGDHMAMYGLNAGIPKTLVRELVKYYKTIYQDLSECLDDICATPISPELAGKTQRTEDLIGKYEVNDFILYRFLGCGDSEDRIKIFLIKDFGLSVEEADNYLSNFYKRFFSQAYKRITMPEGVKVLDLSLDVKGAKFNGDVYYKKNR